MNIYLLSQSINIADDSYDSCIVRAESEEEAKQINPDGSDNDIRLERWSIWVNDVDNVDCTLIGIAIEGSTKGLVLASFNAG